jgi:hypothetical protein
MHTDITDPQSIAAVVAAAMQKAIAPSTARVRQ